MKERARAKKRKAAVSAKKLTQRARLEHKAVSPSHAAVHTDAGASVRIRGT